MDKNDKPCGFCHQKLVLEDGYYNEFDNQIELATGGWTALYIGVNAIGEVVMRACGDGFTKDYFPKYCPECGRRIWGEKDG